MRIARTTAAVVVLATFAGLISWHHSSSGPAKSARAGLIPITGVVETRGGATVVNPGGLDLHPIRSAQVLVSGITLSGRRVRRLMSADHHGRFTLSLVPGNYRFTAVLYQGAIPLAQEPHASVHVRRVQTRVPLRVSIIEPVV
jgi:hypothetical protein